MLRCQTNRRPYQLQWFLSLSVFFILLMHLTTTIAIAGPKKPVSATAPAGWYTWLAEFRQDALNDGIRPEVFDMAMANVIPSRRVVNFDRTQPEKRITFLQYRQSRIDPYRIKLGKQKYRKHRTLIEDIAKEYGVDPCIITALWGMESSYGHYKGNFPVIKSLATLAFDGRRSEFFRKELLHALHILQEGHVDLANFKGEWAGASGHPQFLPSSWRKYAVDHDDDGDKDIWNDLDDVFASIANYLKQNGWKKGQPWAVQVKAPVSLPRGFDEEQHPLWKWYQMGVNPEQTAESSANEIDPNLAAWLIEPYGGPALLAFNNFKVIKRYNNSNFYAGSIGYLADQICHG